MPWEEFGLVAGAAGGSKTDNGTIWVEMMRVARRDEGETLPFE
jgi:hypothetical protein